MNVEQIMTREARPNGTEEYLATAARLMWENDCGCPPVTDAEGQVLAMLTDRDVCMHAWSRNLALADLLVKGAMSARLVSVSPGDPLERAEALMQEHQVRRLPVVDARQRLLGVLSLNDLARESARGTGRRHQEVTERSLTRTLAAVCRPHACRLPAARPATAQRELIASR
jgi:CBS domain-containing protein